MNILHAHRADPSTPLIEQVVAFNQQISNGHCQGVGADGDTCSTISVLTGICQWGVSNVPPAMLEQMLRLCEENGLKKPSCYQGDYNLITRGMETKILPILRAHGIAYNAFRCVNPFFWHKSVSTSMLVKRVRRLT